MISHRSVTITCLKARWLQRKHCFCIFRWDRWCLKHSLKRKKESFSHVWLFVTPWTVAHFASLFMKFSRQKYWNGSPFPPPGDLPDPGIEPASPIGRQTLYHLSHQGFLPGVTAHAESKGKEGIYCLNISFSSSR